MPTKTIRRRKKAAEPEWEEETQIIDVDSSEKDLRQVFRELPQNEDCVELYRINAQGGRPLFLEDMAPNEFSHGYVAGKYGGGMYRLYAEFPDGTKKTSRIEIAGNPFPVNRKMPEELKEGGPVINVNNPAAPTSEGTEVIDYPDQIGVKEILAIMQQAEAKAKREMREMMELFKSMQPQVAVGPQQPMDQMLTMVQKVVELGQTVQGEGALSPWQFILKEMKDPLMKAFETYQMAVQKGVPPNMMVGAPGSPTDPNKAALPSPTEPVSTDPPPPKSEEEVFTMLIKSMLPALINAAKKNAEPERYADFILDQLPESVYPYLQTFLQKQDCLDQLAKLEPGILYQQDWWESLRSALLSALNEEMGNVLRTVQPPPNPDPPETPSTHSEDLS